MDWIRLFDWYSHFISIRLCIIIILQLFVTMAVVLIWSVHNQIIVPVLVGGVDMIVLQVSVVCKFDHNHVFVIAICIDSCGVNMECLSPDKCTCIEGWTGGNCTAGT